MARCARSSVDYEPARGNYTVWRFDRAAQGDDRVSLGVVTRGHLMATSRQFVALGDGQLLLAADGAAHSASTVAGELPSAGGDAYEMWACSTSDAYSPSDALPCHPVATQMVSVGRTHAPSAVLLATARARARPRASHRRAADGAPTLAQVCVQLVMRAGRRCRGRRL